MGDAAPAIPVVQETEEAKRKLVEEQKLATASDMAALCYDDFSHAGKQREYCIICHYNDLKGKKCPNGTLRGSWKIGVDNSSNKKNHMRSYHAHMWLDKNKDVLDTWIASATAIKRSGYTPNIDETLAKMERAKWQLAPADQNGKDLVISIDPCGEEQVLFDILVAGRAFWEVGNPHFIFSHTNKTGKPFPEVNRKNFADKAEIFLGKVRALILTQFKDQEVSLVCDKGRIQAKDYIPFCIVAPKTGRMMVWKLVYVAHKDDGGDIYSARAVEMVTAANVIIDEIAAAGLGISVTSICTDNAANMLKFVDEFSKDNKIFGTPCMCHGIQLFLGDVFGNLPTLTTIFSKAAKIRHVYNMRRIKSLHPFARQSNDTRWNSSYYELFDIVVNYKVVLEVVSGQMPDPSALFDAGELGFAESMCGILKNAEMATKVCEGNTSTLVDGMIALQLLFEMEPDYSNARHEHIPQNTFEDALKARCEDAFLLSEPLIALVYFCPVFDRTCLKGENNCEAIDMKRYVRNIITTAGLVEKLGLEESKVIADYDEWSAIHMYTAFDDDELATFTAEKYMESITKLKWESLRKILQHFSGLIASEAAAERVFSVLGKTVGSSRSRLSAKNAFLALQGKLLLNNNQFCKKDAAAAEKLMATMMKETAVMVDDHDNEEQLEVVNLDEDAAENNNNKNNNEALLHHQSLRSTVGLTPEMLEFMVRCGLHAYVTRSKNTGTTFCANCIFCQKSEEEAILCMKKKNNSFFQCTQCSNRFSIPCYNLKHGTQFVSENGTTDCVWCTTNKSIDEMLTKRFESLKQKKMKAKEDDKKEEETSAGNRRQREQ